MRVLVINGSSRKSVNTQILIDRIFEKLNAVGIETEPVQLAGEIIEPCKACFACGGWHQVKRYINSNYHKMISA